MLTAKQIKRAIKLQAAVEKAGGPLRDEYRHQVGDELWPCSDCGWTTEPCECVQAESCRECGEYWAWCECEREL